MHRVALATLLLFSPLGSAHADCVDYAADPSRMVELEPYASRGALDDQQVACLESAYASATIQTVKDKISRVLLVNAYAYDTRTWADLVQRHLDEVDRSDPNIAYLYSFYLYNRQSPNYEDVIRWVDVAMERRQEWTGDVFVDRTYQLHKARSMSAYQVWKKAEEQGVGAEEVEDLRNRAKTSAREWLDFAKSSGKSTEEAAQFCVSAATEQACGL